MEAITCPHLGTLDARNRREPPATFPSFENQCLASGAAELILLGDQATYCLAAGYATCPRFRAAAGQQPHATGEFVPLYQSAEARWQAADPMPATAPVGLDAFESLGADATAPGGRRRWAWLGAGLIFASVLLCGALTATYTGWEWVSRRLPDGVAAGRVDTLAPPADTATPAVYLVLTATPAVPPPAPVAQAEQATAAAGIIGVGTPVAQFPEAVTPTPITLLLPGSQAGAAATAVPLAAGTESGATPLVDVQLLVPTRRPTPEFDLPTSTPLPDLPTATPSATPVPLGTPVVIFAPASKELREGECTLVRWNVMNVREVYYENLPMNGQGEREECIDDENETYTLMVILGDGQTQIYTTTVTYLPPTPTPTATPSFTPEPAFTPTWTPPPTTATPVPNAVYVTNLAVNGASTVDCAAGQRCDVGLLVSNGGSGVDSFVVMLTAPGAFPLQICRPDGVCGADSLPISSIGPGNTAFVTAQVSIPEGTASGTQTSYSFQSFSEGSGRGVSSAPATISIRVP